MTRPRNSRQATPGTDPTRTELAYLVRVAWGWKYDQIARDQGVRTSTVGSLLSRVYSRLGATNGTTAVVIALRKGYLRHQDGGVIEIVPGGPRYASVAGERP